MNQELTPFVCRLTDAPRQVQLPSQFFYVSQDNYLVVPVHSGSAPRYLYSDSATSCVIVVMQGHDQHGEEIVFFTHTSGGIRSERMFEVIDNTFVGPVNVWAQGANPPEASSSHTNIVMINSWLEDHAQPDSSAWYVNQAECYLGQGDPRFCNRGEFGVDLHLGVISNRSFELESNHRDPTGGLQSLFTLFGRHVQPKLLVWDASHSFPHSATHQMVDAAWDAGWTVLLDLDSDTILRHCSTTPDYEPDWFVDTLLQSAQFVLLQRASRP